MNTNNGKAPEAFTGAATRLQFLGYVNRKAKAYATHPDFLPLGKRNAFLRDVANTGKSIITPQRWEKMKDNPQAQELRANITLAWSRDYFLGVPSDLIERRYAIHLERMYSMIYDADQTDVDRLDLITACASFVVERGAEQDPNASHSEKVNAEIVATEFLTDFLTPVIWDAIKEDAAAKNELALLAFDSCLIEWQDPADKMKYYAEQFPTLSKHATWDH
ncbi:hypothetical protein HUE56_21515 [Azospirillum oryzae]|uniref:Uncharacterized protein n=1 Tax=Azospirillum oryzae TaxID=286727 RepID=A0A6N1AR03_9PROT|nr:hypothetical protein [Azospirillum oryzae]KAA0590563.1 hypothetical protein FZ938_00150 [Azospirillum oryzae]QKS52927.1 hypothetical protein HUE56_21515 [Azospirillum oryzae]GLR80131.1 hypothetical protein GCM10007856_28080 [Azospirillum oryzae]